VPTRSTRARPLATSADQPRDKPPRDVNSFMKHSVANPPTPAIPGLASGTNQRPRMRRAGAAISGCRRCGSRCRSDPCQSRRRDV
jgi:hypothetical protein